MESAKESLEETLQMIKEDGKWVADDCHNEEFSYKECDLEAIEQMEEWAKEEKQE